MRSISTRSDTPGPVPDSHYVSGLPLMTTYDQLTNNLTLMWQPTCNAEGHDEGAPTAQRDHALPPFLEEDEVDGSRQEEDDLVPFGVHLPGGPALLEAEDPEQTPRPEIGALRKGLPEVLPDLHQHDARAVVEVDVGMDRVEVGDGHGVFLLGGSGRVGVQAPRGST